MATASQIVGIGPREPRGVVSQFGAAAMTKKPPSGWGDDRRAAARGGRLVVGQEFRFGLVDDVGRRLGLDTMHGAIDGRMRTLPGQHFDARPGGELAVASVVTAFGHGLMASNPN